jgi:hypothetical protein
MKSLNEKRMLVKFAKMLGQPIDPALLESIEKEERLSKMMFGFVEPEAPTSIEKQIEIVEELPVIEEVPEPVVEEIPEPVIEEILEPVVEAIKPPSPDVAQTGVDQIRGVDRQDLINQTVNAISNTKFADKDDKVETLGSKLQNSELNSLKKQIANIMSRLGTLSMGGGGTGVVRIGATDDFDSSSYAEGRVLRWIRGAFRLDDVGNINSWILKTANYTASTGDRIIGDTSAGSITITLPASPVTGQDVTIIDGSDWSVNPITIARNGATIEGISDDMISNNKGIIIKLVYNGNPGIDTWQVAATLGPRGPAGYGEVSTSTVTSSTYTVNDTDWYVGVNYAGPSTVTLPATANTGRIIAIKDESGNASVNPITVSGTVDNDAGGFIIQIDNGGVQLLYRNGWRII